MNRYWLLVAASLALAACKTADTTHSAGGTPGGASAGGAASNGTKVAASSSADLAPDAASVYFDFDRAEVKGQFKQALAQQAAWMKSHGKDSLTLEGNADERGSAEYNLALGNRRAVAVRKALVTLGVPERRIKDVSFGKEKPRETCHEEKCWAENRRVDFVHDRS